MPLRRSRTGQVSLVGSARSRQRREVMSQHSARPDQHAKSAEEEQDVTVHQARQPEQRPGAPARPPVEVTPPGDGGVNPDEPEDGEFELIGDNDLGPADLGPAAPGARDPDAGSGRMRKLTR
jgi:hypothetical protein